MKDASFPLALGRLLAALRAETGTSQRRFVAVERFEEEALLSAGTLAWIESGRSNATAPQVWNLEYALREAGVLDEPGDLFKLLDRVLANLKQRGFSIMHSSRREAPDRKAVLLVDRVCTLVLLEWQDAKEEAAQRRDSEGS